MSPSSETIVERAAKTAYEAVFERSGGKWADAGPVVRKNWVTAMRAALRSLHLDTETDGAACLVVDRAQAAIPSGHRDHMSEFHCLVEGWNAIISDLAE